MIDNKKRWAKMRKMGKRKFVLVYGVLFWGLLGGLIYSLDWKTFTFDSVGDVVRGVIIFTICGALFGLLLWLQAESRYGEERDEGEGR
ncbi:hypothetical protein STSP2_00309 [Anaerohalosphaera lusitana]|uniref:Uncharacterized protein n=1 Tax=Anaerohalosphaera lusitana TaxID=1936003 RepID=A0A1U9NI29_9BACT|nr:hypothetical protein [Anaerohalosphaera lusitana]AQT67166.1 hypothetical protein STSP2_00309 [Anaerohalosphaera lusitana]